ncbi:DoxX family protein [Microbacterium sp. Ag1]|uniref:DoxX family protein n=1 Tax=Microbacterium sp. Ag1 TaxID=1643443 RepID=UPI000628FB8E|nr:membrane protein [Microbacterium sp. Ag1]KKX98946.1 membrane protein [Microbacterium sp. Ag1]
MDRAVARWILAVALGAIGVGHFLSTRGFRVVVPDWATRLTRLDKDTIVIASGAAEIALAAGLLVLPKGRRRIGWATAAFFVAVMPGNVHQWRTKRSTPGLDTDARRLGRLFLQPLLVLWALWSTSDSTPRGRRSRRRRA